MQYDSVTVFANPGGIKKGDEIIVGGEYATVISVTKYAPDGRRRPENCPIHPEAMAYAFKTKRGTRWVGGRAKKPEGTS